MLETMGRTVFLSVAALLMAVSCVSCGGGERESLFSRSQTVDPNGWRKDEVLDFEVPVNDTASVFAFMVNLRNRTDYAYKNLYLFVNVKAPDGREMCDTLNYALAYDSGEWTGAGGMFSKYRENTFYYRNNIVFPMLGTYTVSFRHGMREESLNGIASVGLILKHS
ncbi:MAG: gliding motility lipoprotein GldH [Prevotellaceae bacterium]|jgi:gliding motility-associated lipoprotein GldH|nr:gliding motility lipoprotein GldH [Prevotellaceae bacterium]